MTINVADIEIPHYYGITISEVLNVIQHKTDELKTEAEILRKAISKLSR